MYDFNFRRTLVQKPTVLTVCPGVFFPPFSGSRIYIPTVLEYWKTICRIVFAFFFSYFSSPVRLKIYSSITFRVSALSGRKRVVHGRASYCVVCTCIYYNARKGSEKTNAHL